MAHKKHLCAGLIIGLGIYHTAAVADHPTIAFGNEAAGAINTISANSQPVGSWGFGLRTEVFNNDEFSTEQLEDFADDGLEGVHSLDKITNTSFSLSYGVSEKLGISLRLPFIKRENIREGEIEDGIPEAHSHGDSSGFGDLLLFGQYKVVEQSSADVAILFGIKAPTGETNEKDDGDERFETEFQPGSGSWDILLGAAISKESGAFGYHANILYNKTTEGSQATEIGDAISYNVALTHQLNSHADHDHDHHDGAEDNVFKWTLSAELNGETRRKNKIDGMPETHSGGTTVYLSPGVRVSAGQFSSFVSYGVPIVEDQNGTQTDVDSRIVAGLSLAF